MFVEVQSCRSIELQKYISQKYIPQQYISQAKVWFKYGAYPVYTAETVRYYLVGTYLVQNSQMLTWQILTKKKTSAAHPRINIYRLVLFLIPLDLAGQPLHIGKCYPSAHSLPQATDQLKKGVHPFPHRNWLLTSSTNFFRMSYNRNFVDCERGNRS